MDDDFPTSGIFLSYAKDDSARVASVHRGLKDHGFSVAWDKMIPPAERWANWLKHEIKRARTVVVCGTLTSISSDSVEYEIEISREFSKEPVVLALDEITLSKLPWKTKREQLVELFGLEDPTLHPNWQTLIASLEGKLRPRWVNRQLSRLRDNVDEHITRRQEAEDAATALRMRLATEADERVEISRQRDEARTQAEHLARQLTDEREKVGRLTRANARLADVERLAGLELQAVRLEIERLKQDRPTIGPPVRDADGKQSLQIGLIDGVHYEAPALPDFTHRLIRLERGSIGIACPQKSLNGAPVTPFTLPLETETPLLFGERLVSRSEWDLVMNDRAIAGPAAIEDAPRTNVSVKEVVQFVDRLNARTHGGFYLPTEKDWLYACMMLTATSKASKAAGDATAATTEEWISEEWSPYADRVSPGERAAEKSAGLIRLVRPNCLGPDTAQRMHERWFWPADFRSEMLGFRLARRA